MSVPFGVEVAEFPLKYADDVLKQSENEADRLAGQAYLAKANEDAYRLAQEALALDPEHVDALVLAATRRESPREERIAELRHAVAVAERRLGPEQSLLDRGHLWERKEGKAYMGATLTLAEQLRRARQHDEAVALYERLLELDEADPLDVQYILLGRFLEAGDPTRAGAIVARFPEDQGPVMLWGKALYHFLIDDYASAREDYDEAMAANRWVEDYLTGRMKYDTRHRPALYLANSPGEALLVLYYLWDAWKAHPEAAQWIKKGAKPPKGRKK